MRFLPALAIGLALLVPAGAGAEERTAVPHELAPTQVEIGGYAAGFKLRTWKREAQEAGVPFERYVRGGLRAKFAAKAIPAIVDPSGQIRVLDGHHKLTALRKVERDMGIVTPVKLDIIKDYSGYSFEAYAKHLVKKLGKGYFGAQPPKTAVAKVESLPKSFDRLGDNPLRSVLGVVFTEAGLEGSWFVDYVQFHLGERMLQDGLLKELAAEGLLGKDGKLTRSAAGNARITAFFKHRIFSDPKLVAFLRRRVKPANRPLARPAITQARRTFAKPPIRQALRKSSRVAKTRTTRERTQRRPGQRQRAHRRTRARASRR